jgi:hypothetical protein
VRFCKGKQELQWASNLAAMCQVSLVGYVVGGAFLTLAYVDQIYDIVAIMLLLEKVLMRMPATPAIANGPAPALPARPGALGGTS